MRDAFLLLRECCNVTNSCREVVLSCGAAEGVRYKRITALFSGSKTYKTPSQWRLVLQHCLCASTWDRPSNEPAPRARGGMWSSPRSVHPE